MAPDADAPPQTGSWRRRVARIAIFLAWPGCALLAMTALFLGPSMHVMVGNAGSTDLTDVQVHVRGRVYDLEDVPPGVLRIVRVEPKGESSAAVTWATPDGERHKRKVDCYFEGGGPYDGAVVVLIDAEKVRLAEARIRLWPFGSLED